jgi:hypothetical protein
LSVITITGSLFYFAGAATFRRILVSQKEIDTEGIKERKTGVRDEYRK